MKKIITIIRKQSRHLLASFLFLGLSASSASAASLAGQWLQTGSNAGYCGDCSVTIERTSSFSPMLQITANNGWSAQVTLSGYGTETANGFGRWDRAVAGQYAGHVFQISLKTTGSILKLNMQHMDPALSGTVTATFSKRQHAANNNNPQPEINYPYQASSWGGIVRTGPGMHFDRTASLFEKEAITIVARTSEMMNGYPWMQVKYRNNQYGYQWGGIICATDHPRSELHELCYAPQQQQNEYQSTTLPRDTARYKCNDGTVMDVRLDNRAAETLAVVERDGISDYLVQIVSASGSLYSNGIIDLHTKADFALLSENADTLQCHVIDDLADWTFSSNR